jgi:hypothetical protein
MDFPTAQEIRNSMPSPKSDPKFNSKMERIRKKILRGAKNNIYMYTFISENDMPIGGKDFLMERGYVVAYDQGLDSEPYFTISWMKPMEDK